MTTIIISAVAGIAAWFATNFLGRPILDLRECRLNALKIAERYSGVSLASSAGLRGTALTAYVDAGNAFLAYSREGSIAVRLWCRVFGYDLEIAALCLFGLADGPRGHSVSNETRRNTLNALHVSLGAAHHLSRADLTKVRKLISEHKAH